jgi:hypothetical protein
MSNSDAWKVEVAEVIRGDHNGIVAVISGPWTYTVSSSKADSPDEAAMIALARARERSTYAYVHPQFDYDVVKIYTGSKGVSSRRR